MHPVDDVPVDEMVSIWQTPRKCPTAAYRRRCWLRGVEVARTTIPSVRMAQRQRMVFLALEMSRGRAWMMVFFGNEQGR